MKNPIITISRQCGSNGHNIGCELAKRMGVPFYDKKIIEMTAKKSGFGEKFIEENGEYRKNNILSDISRGLLYGEKNSYGDFEPLQNQIYNMQTKIILELAEKGSCVIVGRSADHILRNRKDILNVFICADMEFKIKHIMERDNLTKDEAEKTIRRRDKSRASHYHYYTEKKWGYAPNYHLCLDSSKIGIEGCITMIEEACYCV